MEGKSQQASAAASGMSVRTSRTWHRGRVPSEKKGKRRWRTRPDPFAGVWAEEVEPLLRSDVEGALKATTILEWLEERHPGRFSMSQLRTLQRRLRDWRALSGPDREVYFEQDHPPGREAQMDFTHCGELGVTVGGEPFGHLLFHFVLSHSGWRYVDLAYGETFAALVKGMQGALWELGGVPEVVRTDNLSAATHELKGSGGRALNERYAAVLAHYGLRSTRTNPRSSHENGVAEQGHHRLKDAIGQALVLRGSRDFGSVDVYLSFVRQVSDKRNRLIIAKVEHERRHLRPLPPAPVPEYVVYRTKVRRWSTVRVSNHTYTVPSRLIGMEVEVRQYADHLEVCYKGRLVERMDRVHGAGQAGIDYRHVIGSLVRKPGAFARYRYREHMFPTETFRLAYDALREWKGERADVEYVRILQLAATTMESGVARALRLLLVRARPSTTRRCGRWRPRRCRMFPSWHHRDWWTRRSACWGCAMSTSRVASNGAKERLEQLCSEFKLPTVGAEAAPRFAAAGHADALLTLVEVLEQEAEDRRQRRIIRLRRASKLPVGKTWDTFEHDRVPVALRQQLGELVDGSFVERGINLLAFGLPGTGKTHAMCAIGHRLVESGRSVLFTPAYRLVQDMLAAKRDLDLPRMLRKLDNFDFLLVDDLGYLPQGTDESEVLFTLIAERYERRSLGITSNLVFSQWDKVFDNPMATAAAIDRIVHHSIILEFDVPSYRTGAAQQRLQQEANRQE